MKITFPLWLSVSIGGAAGFSLSAYSLGLQGLYPHHQYLSTDVVGPQLNWLRKSDKCAGGDIILGPRGWATPAEWPVVLDADGELLYSGREWGDGIMDWEVQTYKGRKFLTFWNGTDDGTHGHGQYYMLNAQYEVEHIVSPQNGLEGDLHEFEITDDDTALMSIYERREHDLTAVDGPEDGWIHDAIIQEINIETGEVLFEWHAADSFEMTESFNPRNGCGETDQCAWDPFHLNSVAKGDDGNYYISMRYTHSVTCVRPDGSICWKLGGTKSSFEDLSDGAASNFMWQHHARMHGNDTLTVFDNGQYDVKKNVPQAEQSRGLAIHLDTDAMTAEIITEMISPDHIGSHSQGSLQLLDNGNYLVGWGHTAAMTEFSPDGEVLCNAHFAPAATFGWGWVKSYRNMKAEWYGAPTTPPDVVLSGGKAYVSWNGATEVRFWEVQTAEDADAEDGQWTSVKTDDKRGFETAIDVGGAARYVRLQALDAEKTPLGLSNVLDTQTGHVRINGKFKPAPIYGGRRFGVVECLGVVAILVGIVYLIRRPRLWRSKYRGYTPLKLMTSV